MNTRSIGAVCLSLIIAATSTPAATNPQSVLPVNLTPEARKSREIWLRETEGENLDMGR